MASDNPPVVPRLLDPSTLDQLIAHLIAEGYQVIGPGLNDGVIRLGEIQSSQDLARGITDVQTPGRYHLINHLPDTPAAQAFFSNQVGPDSARAHLLPYRTLLWQAHKNVADADEFTIALPEQAAPKLAFLGLRACDLAAIAKQDRIFIHDTYQQSTYAAHRQACLIIAVQCTTHAQTCFCTSMNTGPDIKTGFDLLLTEQCNQSGHWFIAQSGSAAGTALQQALALPLASPEQQHLAQAAVAENARTMPKFNLSGLKTALKKQPENPWWEEVAQRCLSCANCTLVCPTCFCTTVEDSTDLTGNHAERWLNWDSCFNEEHSQLHNGKVHQSIASRYRQWLTHKLSTWHDQFDSSGCVGCGRCISWCPVGIDLRQAIEPFSKPQTKTKNNIIKTVTL